MDKEKIQQFWTKGWKTVLLIALALTAIASNLQNLSLFGPPEEAVARSYNTAVYTEQGGAKLVASSGGEIEVQSGATLDLQSGSTTTFASIPTFTSISSSGTITQSNGNLIVADWLRIVAQTSITVSTHITPTGSYQPLTAAAWVTPTVAPASGFTNGFILYLVNNSTSNINIADSGNIVLSAAALLGQYDTLTLRSDGTRWVELERSNN